LIIKTIYKFILNIYIKSIYNVNILYIFNKIYNYVNIYAGVD